MRVRSLVLTLFAAQFWALAAAATWVVEGHRGIGTTMTDEWARRTGPDAQRILQAYRVRSAGGQ